MVIDTDLSQAGQARLLRAGYGPRYVLSLQSKLLPNWWGSLLMVILTVLQGRGLQPAVAAQLIK